MRAALLTLAFTILASSAFAGTPSPTPAAAVNNCSLAARNSVVPPTDMESTCKHHLNLPNRFLKVSG